MGKIVDSKGMKAFICIWAGQMISAIGTGLTGFVLGLWVYQKTGSVTLYTYIAMFTVLPGILVLPFSGVLVDRYDRRIIMIFSSLIAGINIATVAFFCFLGRLDLLIICLTMGISSVCNAFQYAAYTASISVLVPEKNLVRANGLVQAGDGAAMLVSPMLASILLAKLDVWGVIIIDFATFIIAVASCLLIRIPMPEKQTNAGTGRRIFFKDAIFGLKYIKEHRGLLMLLLFFALINYFVTTVSILSTPLALSFTTPVILGTALSIAGSGMIFGSIFISAWGGPKRAIKFILSLVLMIGVFLVSCGLKPSVVLVTFSAFCIFFIVPVQQSCSNAIWQTRVPFNLQGRVFSMRRMIAQASIPLAYLSSGNLAEKVFSPLLKLSAVSNSIGKFIGTGKGREIALMFICMGVLTMIAAFLGFLSPSLREMDLQSEKPETAARSVQEKII